MNHSEEGKSMGVKTVSTKLAREEYTRLQYFCKLNKEPINAFLKRIAMTEVDNPQLVNVAGTSTFEYNRQKDNFSWKVVLDDNSELSIDDNLSANSVAHFLESLNDMIEQRKSIIKKSKKNSVLIPSKLMRKKK